MIMMLSCTESVKSILEATKLFCLPEAAPRGGGLVTPNPKSRQTLSKKNGLNLVGYTFRLKNYVKIPPPHFSQIFQSWHLLSPDQTKSFFF